MPDCQREAVKKAGALFTADFRKYPCVEDSIANHSAYLLGAKNDGQLRYGGLKVRVKPSALFFGTVYGKL